MKSFCSSNFRISVILLTFMLITQPLRSQDTPDWIKGRADKNSIINAVGHGDTKLHALAPALSLLSQKLDATIENIKRDYTEETEDVSQGMEASKTVASIWFGDVKVQVLNKYYSEAADGDQPAAEYNMEMCKISMGDSLQAFTLKYLHELSQYADEQDDQCYLEVTGKNLKLTDLIAALDTAGIQMKTFEEDFQYHVLLIYDVNNYEPPGE